MPVRPRKTPGQEEPLLLDPANPADEPAEHLWFRPRDSAATDWWVFPRNGSRRGAATVEILGLNRDSLRELRNLHVRYLGSRLDELRDLARDANAWGRRARELVEAPQVYAGLNRDVIAHHFPHQARQQLQLAWPL